MTSERKDNDKGSQQPMQTEPDKKLPSGGKVLNFSFDFDGCLAFGFGKWLHTIVDATTKTNPFEGFGEKSEMEKVALITKYRDQIAQKILEDNKTFMDQLAQFAVGGGYAAINIMIGTNRQSLWRDQFNAKQGGGSCIPVYRLMESYLQKRIQELKGTTQVKFDSYLLTDTYFSQVMKPAEGKIDYGTAVSNAGVSLADKVMAKGEEYTAKLFGKIHDTFGQGVTAENKEAFQESPEWLWDFTKVSIIYHQLQRSAIKAPPGSEIELHFYDDKLVDILKPLFEFFSKNTNFIPNNVSLHLHQYIGGQLMDSAVKIPPIKGTGKVDVNYKDTIVLMAAAALGYKPEDMENPNILFGQIKQAVYGQALSMKSIGLYNAPDVMQNANCFKYNADTLRYARDLCALKVQQAAAIMQAQMQSQQQSQSSPMPPR